jgi:cyclase
MLKRRLIPVLYIKNGLIVRSEGFNYHQNIGNVVSEAERYDQWNVDELVYIDISREPVYDLRRDDMKVKSLSSVSAMLEAISRVCFMPLTFGGGIRDLEQVGVLIRSGADKVTVNTGAIKNPNLISDIATKYGSQCVVVSIDYRLIDGRAVVFTMFGTLNTGIDLIDWMRVCEQNGAGEFLLNAIDRDGKANGYDIPTMTRAAVSTRVPVIGCGGAGDDFHFVDLARQSGVSGLAAGNFFHFTELSYPRVKRLLLREGINVRP